MKLSRALCGSLWFGAASTFLPFAFSVNVDFQNNADSLSPNDVFSSSGPGFSGPLAGPSVGIRLATILTPPPAATKPTDVSAPSLPPPERLRALRRTRKASAEAPVAFASRVPSSEMSDEELEDDGSLRLRRLPVVSCSAAKALVCVTGAAAVGAVGLRLTLSFLRKRRRSKLGAPWPPSRFTRLLGDVLLSNSEGKKKGFLSKLSGEIADEAATAQVLGQENSATALYFTGKGVEQILQNKGYVPFTPRLKSIVEAAAQKGQKLNVVFVSADNDAADAFALFQTMPWYAIPFDDSEGQERIRSLYRKFRITSLPHVVLLDAEGRVSNPNAYTAMLANPVDFPWKRKSLLQLLGPKFVNNRGETVDAASLSGKTLGIYISASWCPPCQNFTPKLVETVHRLKEKGEQVEVVFVSNDRDEESFSKYFSKMEWLAVPFKDAATRAVVQDSLGVRALPTLIWVSPNGEVLTRRGVPSLLKDPEGASFPWKEKTVKDVDDAIESIAEEPVLVAFLNGADEEAVKQVKKAMDEAAAALKEGDAGSALFPIPQFLMAKTGSPRTAALRQICKEGLPQGGATGQVSLIILDVFSQQVYAHPGVAGAISKESLVDFVNKFRNEEIVGKPIALPD